MMKKAVLFFGVAMLPFAAQAQEPALQLGMEGHMAVYAVYTDPDMSGVRRFDFRKYGEVALHGEVALDNGITAGAEIKMLVDRADSGDLIEESFVYLASKAGRVNFGESHGAAYLLQVAIPAVDENIDGLKPHISTTGAGTWGSYANHDSEEHNKLTYFTPVFNGFQVGASYTPSISYDVSGLAPAQPRNRIDAYENGWEIAARYEGSFDAVDVQLGAGYSHAQPEVQTGAEDDLKTYNVSGTIGYEAYDLGLGYTQSNDGLKGDNAMKVWAAGANYSFGNTRYGVSYRHITGEREAQVLPDVITNRWTAGAVYNWAPGISTRGAVQYFNVKDAGTKSDIVQVTLGTQINF